MVIILSTQFNKHNDKHTVNRALIAAEMYPAKNIVSSDKIKYAQFANDNSMVV